MRDRKQRAQERLERIEFCLNRGTPSDKKQDKALKAEKKALMEALKASK